MVKGTTVCLTGANAVETAKILGARLIELGRNAELIDAEAVDRLGGPTGAARACLLLTRNGVVVVSTSAGFTPEGDAMPVEIDLNDTPDFAAEKILDALAGAGLVSLETGGYSPEEEEQIRRRLASLGYIE